MALYTRAELENDLAIIAAERHKIITLLTVADVVPIEWRLDGLEALRRLRFLENEVERLTQKYKGTIYFLSVLRKEMEELKKAKGLLGENGMSRAKWESVDPDMAIKLKQRGYEVRCIGLKAWEWKVS